MYTDVQNGDICRSDSANARGFGQRGWPKFRELLPGFRSQPSNLVVIETVWNLLVLFAVKSLILLRLPCCISFAFEVGLEKFPDREWHARQDMMRQDSQIKVGPFQESRKRRSV